MDVANKKDFFLTKARRYKTIEKKEVPVLPKDARIQSITEAERIDMVERMRKDKRGGQAEPAYVMALASVDEDGDRIFTYDDVKHIMEIDSAVVNAIYKAVDRLSEGVDSSRENDRTDDAVKNSNGTSGSASTSDSPSNADESTGETSSTSSPPAKPVNSTPTPSLNPGDSTESTPGP